MTAVSVLKLAGARYRCLPQYVQFDELDPLLLMFLEVLKYERNVGRLVRAFGLSERIVEDILAELIRRNRATLIFQGGEKEIRPLAMSLPHAIREDTETLEVWQDFATGLVLPAWSVDPYVKQRSSDSGVLIRTISRKRRIVRDFGEAGHAELIDMLLRSDEQLRHRDEGYAVLDRLTERYRVRPQTIWLPLDVSETGGHEFVVVAADRLPLWASRVLSAAVRQEATQVGALDEINFVSAGIPRNESLRLLHGWRQQSRVAAWRTAVHGVLEMLPPPRSGYDLRHVRERQAELVGLFLSVVKADVSETQSATPWQWGDSILDESRHWVAIVVPWQASLDHVITWLRARAERGSPMPRSIILIDASPERTWQAPAQDARAFGLTTIIRSWPADGPALILGDCGQVCMRHDQGAATVTMAGTSVAGDCLSLIQALGSPTEESRQFDPFRRLKLSRVASDRAEDASLGAAEGAPTIGAAIEELRTFQQRLLTAVVDPDAVQSNDTSATKNRERRSLGTAVESSLGELLPVLFDEAADLSSLLALAPGSPSAFLARFVGDELLSVLVSVLTEPQASSIEGTLHLMVDRVSELASSTGICGLIERAVVEYRWRVHIGLTARDKSFSDTGPSLLRAKIPSPRLRFYHLTSPVRAHALVLGDLTFLAGSDWLGSMLEIGGDGADFGFGLDSLSFADTLRSAFNGAEEIAPAG